MVEVVASPDTIAAVGGTLMPANDIVIDGPDIVDRRTPRNYWVGCQLIEYLTAFLVARAWVGAHPGDADRVRRLRVVPPRGGHRGRRRYHAGHLGEDMDMCLRVQRYLADRGEEYRVVQVPESLCWTEFPPSTRCCVASAFRWHRA